MIAEKVSPPLSLQNKNGDWDEDSLLKAFERALLLHDASKNLPPRPVLTMAAQQDFNQWVIDEDEADDFVEEEEDYEQEGEEDEYGQEEEVEVDILDIPSSPPKAAKRPRRSKKQSTKRTAASSAAFTVPSGWSAYPPSHFAMNTSFPPHSMPHHHHPPPHAPHFGAQFPPPPHSHPYFPSFGHFPPPPTNGFPHAVPPASFPPPPPTFQIPSTQAVQGAASLPASEHDPALAQLLLSWYYSGYYAGRYEALGLAAAGADVTGSVAQQPAAGGKKKKKRKMKHSG